MSNGKKQAIRTASGGTHPVPRAFGLNWLEIEPYLEEHEGLSARYRDAKGRLEDLEGKIRSEESTLPKRRAEATRKGEEVDTTALEKLREDAKEARSELEDIQAASRLVEKDLQAVLEENQEAYLEQIEQKRMQAAVEAESIRRELARVEWWFTATDRLRSYLKTEYVRGGRRFQGVPARPEEPAKVGADA